MFSLFGSNSTSARISKLEQLVNDLDTTKVDKITGKGLSTHDFTAAYKAKLDSLDDEIFDPVIPYATVASDDYVTPQMFGATGKNNHDDTAAIQQAVDSGKSVFFPRGEYLITEPIIITDAHYRHFDASDAVIRYIGDDYAIRINNATHCRIDIAYIKAFDGGGIEFLGDDEDRWNQYIEAHVACIGAKTDCIHVETKEGGWSNENQIHGCRFLAGENGVCIHRDGEHGVSGWKFYNCGIEGVKNGFMFDAGDEYIGNMVVVNPRYGESFETILKTKGLVADCMWIAPSRILPEFIEASATTTRFAIYAPIGDHWHMHDTAYIRGCIMDGVLMGERPTYETVK